LHNHNFGRQMTNAKKTMEMKKILHLMLRDNIVQ
jgi:hypothetical protein